jgi:hypothetical protein
VSALFATAGANNKRPRLTVGQQEQLLVNYKESALIIGQPVTEDDELLDVKTVQALQKAGAAPPFYSLAPSHYYLAGKTMRAPLSACVVPMQMNLRGALRRLFLRMLSPRYKQIRVQELHLS